MRFLMSLRVLRVLLEFAVLDYYDHYFGADVGDAAAWFGGVFVRVGETVRHCLFVEVRTGDDGLLSILSIPREVNWC